MQPQINKKKQKRQNTGQEFVFWATRSWWFGSETADRILNRLFISGWLAMTCETTKVEQGWYVPDVFDDSFKFIIIKIISK